MPIYKSLFPSVCSPVIGTLERGFKSIHVYRINSGTFEGIFVTMYLNNKDNLQNGDHQKLYRILLIILVCKHSENNFANMLEIAENSGNLQNFWTIFNIFGKLNFAFRFRI